MGYKSNGMQQAQFSNPYPRISCLVEKYNFTSPDELTAAPTDLPKRIDVNAVTLMSVFGLRYSGSTSTASDAISHALGDVISPDTWLNCTMRIRVATIQQSTFTVQPRMLTLPPPR